MKGEVAPFALRSQLSTGRTQPVIRRSAPACRCPLLPAIRRRGGDDPADVNPLYSIAGVLVGRDRPRQRLAADAAAGAGVRLPPRDGGGNRCSLCLRHQVDRTVVHGGGGTVDWKVVRRMASASLLATAIVILFRGRILAHFAHRFPRRAERQVVALTILLGTVLGVLVSLSSVGGCALGMIEVFQRADLVGGCVGAATRLEGAGVAIELAARHRIMPSRRRRGCCPIVLPITARSSSI